MASTQPAPVASSPVAAPGTPPSPALRKRLQQCYEHAQRLMQQEQYDHGYAHSLLVECAVHDPGNLVYVEAFLQNLQRKYRNNKRGSWLAFGGKGPFRKAVVAQDWGAVFRLGPELLRKNPWDVEVLRGLARACAAQGFHEVELRYLKNALAPRPQDPEVNKHCAESLARIGQFDQAIICWERVDEARRGDAEAQRMIADLQIAKTQGRGGLVSGESARKRGMAAAAQVAAEKEAAQDMAAPPPADEKREIRLTRRQELEQEIVNRPADLESYLELAQLHIGEERLADATHVLTKALAVSGNSLQVQERLEDVDLLRKRQQLAIAERLAQSDPQSEKGKLVPQLREDLLRMELEVFARRSQRYPNNADLQFQLGVRLKRLGNLREALKCFQATVEYPSHHAESLLERGECQQRLKQYDQALASYQEAARAAVSNREEVRKLAWYRCGVLAEGLRAWDVAEEALAAVVRLDPHFQDAATRLDKLRAMRHKGES